MKQTSDNSGTLWSIHIVNGQRASLDLLNMSCQVKDVCPVCANMKLAQELAQDRGSKPWWNQTYNFKNLNYPRLLICRLSMGQVQKFRFISVNIALDN